MKVKCPPFKRIRTPCNVKGCRNTYTLYITNGMYGYNIYGKMICCLRDEVYLCRRHRDV